MAFPFPLSLGAVFRGGRSSTCGVSSIANRSFLLGRPRSSVLPFPPDVFFFVYTHEVSLWVTFSCVCGWEGFPSSSALGIRTFPNPAGGHLDLARIVVGSDQRDEEAFFPRLFFTTSFYPPAVLGPFSFDHIKQTFQRRRPIMLFLSFLLCARRAQALLSFPLPPSHRKFSFFSPPPLLKRFDVLKLFRDRFLHSFFPDRLQSYVEAALVIWFPLFHALLVISCFFFPPPPDAFSKSEAPVDPPHLTQRRGRYASFKRAFLLPSLSPPTEKPRLLFSRRQFDVHQKNVFFFFSVFSRLFLRRLALPPALPTPSFFSHVFLLVFFRDVRAISTRRFEMVRLFFQRGTSV